MIQKKTFLRGTSDCLIKPTVYAQPIELHAYGINVASASLAKISKYQCNYINIDTVY